MSENSKLQEAEKLSRPTKEQETEAAKAFYEDPEDPKNIEEAKSFTQRAVVSKSITDELMNHFASLQGANLAESVDGKNFRFKIAGNFSLTSGQIAKLKSKTGAATDKVKNEIFAKFKESIEEKKRAGNVWDANLSKALTSQIYEYLYSEVQDDAPTKDPSSSVMGDLLGIRIETGERRLLKTNCHWFKPDTKDAEIAKLFQVTTQRSLGYSASGNSKEPKKPAKTLIEETLRVCSIPCVHDPNELMCFDSFTMVDYMHSMLPNNGQGKMTEKGIEEDVFHHLSNGFFEDKIPVPQEQENFSWKRCAGGEFLTNHQLELILLQYSAAHALTHYFQDKKIAQEDVQAILKIKDELVVMPPTKDGWLTGKTWESINIYRKQVLNNTSGLFRSIAIWSMLKQLSCGLVYAAYTTGVVLKSGTDAIKLAVRTAIAEPLKFRLRQKNLKTAQKLSSKYDVKRGEWDFNPGDYYADSSETFRESSNAGLDSSERVNGENFSGLLESWTGMKLNFSEKGMALIDGALKTADIKSDEELDKLVDQMVDIAISLMTPASTIQLIYNILGCLKIDSLGKLISDGYSFVRNFWEYAWKGDGSKTGLGLGAVNGVLKLVTWATSCIPVVGPYIEKIFSSSSFLVRGFAFLNPSLTNVGVTAVGIDSAKAVSDYMGKYTGWCPWLGNAVKNGVDTGYLGISQAFGYIVGGAMFKDAYTFWAPTLIYIADQIKMVFTDPGNVDVGTISFVLASFLPRMCGVLGFVGSALTIDIARYVPPVFEEKYKSLMEAGASLTKTLTSSTLLSARWLGFIAASGISPVPGTAGISWALKAYTDKPSPGTKSNCERFAAYVGGYIDLAHIAILILQVLMNLFVAYYVFKYHELPPFGTTGCVRAFVGKSQAFATNHLISTIQSQMGGKGDEFVKAGEEAFASSLRENLNAEAITKANIKDPSLIENAGSAVKSIFGWGLKSVGLGGGKRNRYNSPLKKKSPRRKSPSRKSPANKRSRKSPKAKSPKRK